VCLQKTWSDQPYAAIVAASDTACAKSLQAAENLGISLAQKLLDAGAAEILTVAKRQTAEQIMQQKAAKQAAASGSANIAV